VDVFPCLLLHLVRQGLDEVGPGQGIDGIGRPGLLRNDLLGPEGDLHRMVRRQTEDLVQGVRMQRLGPAQHRRQGLRGRPDDIVVRLLRREGTARRLGVETHPPGTGILGFIAVPHRLRPDPPRRPQFGDLFEEINVGIEEERKARGEFIHIQPLAADHVLHVFHPVPKRKGQLLHRRRPRLPDMVPADADGVPPGYVLRPEFHRVADQLHRGIGRTHQGLLGNEFLQHVVLDRPPNLRQGNPLELSRRAVHRPQGRRRRIDRHGRRHPVHGDPIHQLHEIFQGIDGDAALPAFPPGFG